MPTISELRSFITLIELGTQQQTANVLGISKSSVSDHILALERKAGGRLFDRIRKEWHATAGARRLERAARAVVASYDAMVLTLPEAGRAGKHPAALVRKQP